MRHAIAPPLAILLWVGVSAGQELKSTADIRSSSPQILVAAAAQEKDPTRKVEIVKRAAEILLTTDVVAQETDYALLLSLFRLAKDELAPHERFQLANQVSERKETAAIPYAAMRQKVALMYLAGVPLDRRAAEVAGWIESDETQLEGVWEAEFAWLYNSIADPQLTSGSFDAKWSGTLIAPRNGDYVFSISTVDVNAQWETFFIRNHWSVSIGGKEVLKAGVEEWNVDSAPVQLTAGQAVPISVQAEFEVSRPAVDALHAMLFWKGPGTAKQVIPTAALKNARGEPGLDAAYSVKLASGAEVINRVDPTIDFAWTTNRRVVFTHDKALQKLQETVWSRCMEPEYLEGCETGASPRHRHPFLYDLLLVECLTSPQRQAFLEELEQRPALLAKLSAKEAIAFFKAFRFGVEEAAIAAFGQWAGLHADEPPVMPAVASRQAFFDANRLEYHDLGRCIAVQCPAHKQELEEEWLVLDDGSCSLPVAYALAYAYQDAGRLDEWIKILQEQLDDRKIAGEIRVNWLIARASAEELSGVDPSFFTGGNEDVAAGWRWLAEADSIAKDEATSLRTAQELISRESALGQFPSAKSRLQAAQEELGQSEATPLLTDWIKKVEALEATSLASRKTESELAVELYMQEMQRRQAVAESRGDSAEVEKIGTQIEAAK